MTSGEPTGRGLVVVAPRSGAGKTTVTLGLLRAFRNREIGVRGAKCGPDYIDGAFHEAACGAPSLNLDGFAMSPELIAGLAAQAGSRAGLVIAEGAMGLFDGARRPGRSGASADVARLLGWPMLLVVDAGGAAQSVAAVALGCARHPRAPRLAGVIVNRVASARHGRMIEDGFREVGLALLGMVADEAGMALPSRHLGLVQAIETADLDDRLDAVAARIAAQCDLQAIRAAAGPIRPAALPAPGIRPPGRSVAVARDAAFGFFYPHMIEAWRAAGTDILFFSPLADEPPPEQADACWLPGGYPELHAGRLAASTRFLAGLRRFAGTRPVHGECGGYMVLGRSLTDADGQTHAMAGLLPVDTSFAVRRRTLGYRIARPRADTGFAAAGARLLGHEYHYATVIAAEGAALFDLTDGEDRPLAPAGHRAGLVTGSFFHLIA